MPPKKVIRPATNARAPSPSALPPSLAPSVEEAYRRKCIQLKQRTREVEEENEATRIRLARIRRQVEKLRVERAFLLEQLARRTSTNVEDSEGSPSPPPTPIMQPKDKPLRTKRGHRKPSMLPDPETPAKPTSQLSNAAPASPTSEHGDSQPAAGTTTSSSGRKNGASRPPRRPNNAFELYCAATRPSLAAKETEDGKEPLNIEEELARGWKDLPEKEREEFQAQADADLAVYQKEKEVYKEKNKAADAAATGAASSKRSSAEREKAADDEQPAADEMDTTQAADETAAPETQDEDVEMVNYDTEEPETQADDKAD